MFKKIALAAALTATASFATWNYFPVLENHKGQAEVGVTDLMQDKTNQLGLFVGARYTVIPNLELGVKLPYTVFTHWDGEDAKRDGLNNIPLMVRYQFMPIMNAFVDVDLPVLILPREVGDVLEVPSVLEHLHQLDVRELSGVSPHDHIDVRPLDEVLVEVRG